MCRRVEKSRSTSGKGEGKHLVTVCRKVGDMLLVDGCLLLVYPPSPLASTSLGESGIGLGFKVLCLYKFYIKNSERKSKTNNHQQTTNNKMKKFKFDVVILRHFCNFNI